MPTDKARQTINLDPPSLKPLLELRARLLRRSVSAHITLLIEQDLKEAQKDPEYVKAREAAEKAHPKRPITAADLGFSMDAQAPAVPARKKSRG